MSRIAAVLMAFLQVQAWGALPVCFAPECETEQAVDCCGMPLEDAGESQGCGMAVCPCCVSGAPEAEDPSNRAKQLWEASAIDPAPIPVETLLPIECVFRDAGLSRADRRHSPPNAPPRPVLACWIL